MDTPSLFTSYFMEVTLALSSSSQKLVPEKGILQTVCSDMFLNKAELIAHLAPNPASSEDYLANSHFTVQRCLLSMNVSTLQSSCLK